MWGEMTPIGAISDVKELGAPSSATTATLGHMPNGRFDAVDFKPSYRGSVRGRRARYSGSKLQWTSSGQAGALRWEVAVAGVAWTFLAVVAVVVALFLSLSAKLFVWPAQNALQGAHADAIVVLGGPGPVGKWPSSSRKSMLLRSCSFRSPPPAGTVRGPIYPASGSSASGPILSARWVKLASLPVRPGRMVGIA